MELLDYTVVDLAEIAAGTQGEIFDELNHPSIAQLFAVRLRPATAATQQQHQSAQPVAAAAAAESAESTDSSENGLVVANVHFFFHPGFAFLKLLQSLYAMRKLLEFAERFPNFPVLLCGGMHVVTVHYSSFDLPLPLLAMHRNALLSPDVNCEVLVLFQEV